MEKDNKVLLCILLDGLGYELVKRTSSLNDLFQDVCPLKTVLGYSTAAQASILTGLTPGEHGGFCVYYRSLRSIYWWTRLLPFLPKRIRRKYSNRIVEITRRLFKITGHFNIWRIPRNLLAKFQLFEKQGLYTSNPVNGIPTILDTARSKGLNVSSYYWNTQDETIFSETKKKLARREAQFHFLYISRTDHLLHLHGKDSASLQAELGYYAKQIRTVYKIAKENYRNVGMLVFSDHGMLNVTGKVDVMSPISKLSYRLGSDYLAFYDATMARFWFDNKICKRSIMDTMSTIPGIRLLDDNELSDLGCLFPDKRYGEVIYLADGGIILSPSFFGAQDHIRGMHGYHPEEYGYDAFVGSSNIDIGNPKAITDLYGIMRQMLFETD